LYGFQFHLTVGTGQMDGQMADCNVKCDLLWGIPYNKKGSTSILAYIKFVVFTTYKY